MIGYKSMLHKSFTINVKKNLSIIVTPPPTPPSPNMIKIVIIITFIVLCNRKKTK